MTGILIIDKPTDFTSFDVVAKLRGICGTKKIGHSGTLDPMATGVLPIFIGEATKAIDMQENHDKTYVATLKLGIKTNTGDITGEVIQTNSVDSQINMQSINNIIPQFTGQTQQLPPMYSAVKINGVPLYKLARKGENIERQKRSVVIHSIKCLNQIDETSYKLEVHCSKGTYIRTLLEDMAEALGTVGTMSALVRVKAGVYKIESAYTLQQVQEAKNSGTLESLLIKTQTVFEHLPNITVGDVIYKRLLNGAPTYKFNMQNGLYSTYVKPQQTCGKEQTKNTNSAQINNSAFFVGVCEVNENVLNAKKIFVRPE